MKYEQLVTDRLILRNFISTDLDFIYNHFKDSFVSRYLYDNEPPETHSEAQEILDWCMDLDSDHIRWCILLKEDLSPIGTIGFHRYDQQNNSAEIGYDLSESFSNQGFMTESLKCIMSYGRSQYKLHRVHASVSTDNEASNKLLKKNGFQLEGMIRDQYLFRGIYYDHNLWSYIFSEN